MIFVLVHYADYLIHHIMNNMVEFKWILLNENCGAPLVKPSILSSQQNVHRILDLEFQFFKFLNVNCLLIFI